MSSDPFASLDEEPRALYWICGKERFLVDRAVARIKERVIEPATRDFNYDLLYAKEAGAQKILAAARTLPMMARRRLVIVRDADSLDAKGLEPLLPYVASPAPETCLVFVAEKADTRLKFFTAFKKHGELLKCEPLQDRQLPAFLRDEAKARKLKLDAGVAELVAEEVGADLGQLVDAVERLELYVDGRGERRVTVEDVEQVVATTRQRSVFELLDAMGAGEAGRALTALGSLQAAREPPLRTLAMVVRQVRQLIQVRDLLDRRVGKGELAQALGLPPFLVSKLETQAKRYSATTLRAMHAAVYDADRALKSSRVDGDRLMERLVLELVRKGAPASRTASR